MKVKPFAIGTFLVRREDRNEQWPTDWAALCRMRPGTRVINLKFGDGDFIAQTCFVAFEIPIPTEASRDMVNRWALYLSDRRKILEFWEWLEAKSMFIKESGLNIEKLLDEYHAIDRVRLDQQRQALLDKAVVGVECDDPDSPSDSPA